VCDYGICGRPVGVQHGTSLIGCEPFDEPNDLRLIAAQGGGHGGAILFRREADADAIEIDDHDCDGGSVIAAVVVIAGASFDGFDAAAGGHEGSVSQRVAIWRSRRTRRLGPTH
jgi:hypothetical protein